MKAKTIPQFDNIPAMASFWDSHSLTDFDDELEEISGKVFQRAKSITIKLPPKDAAAVKQAAKTKGLTDTQLVRTWVLERLRASKPKRRVSRRTAH